MALSASGRPMTPTEVRDALAGYGFDISKYANDLAAIHAVLKRLNRSGELRFIPRENGRQAYVSARQVHVYSMPLWGGGTNTAAKANESRGEGARGRKRGKA
jgi:hypothetical protein